MRLVKEWSDVAIVSLPKKVVLNSVIIGWVSAYISVPDVVSNVAARIQRLWLILLNTVYLHHKVATDEMKDAMICLFV